MLLVLYIEAPASGIVNLILGPVVAVKVSGTVQTQHSLHFEIVPENMSLYR